MSNQSDVQKPDEKKLEPTNWTAVLCLFAGVAFGCCAGLELQKTLIRKQAIENNAAHFELISPKRPNTKFCWGPAPVKEVEEGEQ